MYDDGANSVACDCTDKARNTVSFSKVGPACAVIDGQVTHGPFTGGVINSD